MEQQLFGEWAYGYEQWLKQEEPNRDPEKTLMVQLDMFELVLVKYGLEFLNRLYPNVQGPDELHDKIIELIRAQEICDCANCRRRREEERHDG